MLLKLIASLIILLNPTAGFFTDSPPPAETPRLSNAENYKLPLSSNFTGDIFIIAQRLPIFPVRNWNIAEPPLSAKIAMVYDADSREILYQKNGINESHPIASITKLMTALVITENIKPETVFEISKKAVQTYGERGDLRVGEKITMENLLYALLVESSNDAATALAENFKNISGKDLVELMNKKAADLELNSTHFVDSSGLDSQNYSSAWDLTKIIQEVLKYPLLTKIMQTQSINVASVDGRYNHHLTATNKLLEKIPEIIGGKTGYTEEAGNCMITAFKSPKEQNTLIAVVMESQDRLMEIEMLIQWTQKAYLW